MQTMLWSPFPPPPMGQRTAKTFLHLPLCQDGLATWLVIRICSRNLSFLFFANLVVSVASREHLGNESVVATPATVHADRWMQKAPRRLQAATYTSRSGSLPRR